MGDFLRGQTDYVAFVCSLGFALLSVASFALRRAGDDRLPWFWVGVFALLCCLAEWQSLVADSAVYGDQFAALGACILLCSVVCLVEFSRRSQRATSGRGPGWWIQVPFLGLALAGGLAGWDGLNAASRYVLALIGALWTPVILYRVSRGAESAIRRPLIAAAWICAVHALLALAMVPKAAFFPAWAINRETTLDSAGLSIPLVRALLSVGAAAAAWQYYRYVRYVHTGRDSLRRLGRLTAVGVPAVLLAGWALTSAVGSASSARLRSNLLARAETAAAAIAPDRAARLTGSRTDIVNPDYTRVRRRLQEILSANPECRFARLVGMRDHRMVCLADAEPVESVYHLAPGALWSRHSDGPALVDTVQAARLQGPATDSRGTWVTALVPITDLRGERVVALLDMDIEAAALSHRVARSRLAAIFAVLAMCIGGIAFLVVVQNKEEFGFRIAASEERYRSLVEASPSWISLLDGEARVRTINPSGLATMGWTEEGVIGVPLRELWPEEARTTVDAAVSAAARGVRDEFEAECTRADGRDVSWRVVVVPGGDQIERGSHIVVIGEDITDRKRHQERLDHLAHHDSLTGLPNRLLFSDRLTQRIAQAHREEQQLAVMFLDLDRFKLTNDTYGHGTGDRLLQAVAERLSGCLREVDTIARMGGDEFTIVLGGVSDATEATQVARKLIDALGRSFSIGGREIAVSASLGISLYPCDGVDAETLVRNADAAMYRAKEERANPYQFYGPALNVTAVERLKLEESLRRGLNRGELVVYYQPRVDIETGQILGAEALVRWQHPEFGFMHPAQFIPVAEESGLIVPITRHVLQVACAQNKAWQEEGIPPIEVAVNISARHVAQKTLVRTVKQVLKQTGLDARYLGLELTESALAQDPETAAQVVGRLKSIGVSISIDDFGTGHSSLSCLRRLPIDGVKIDQSFVRNITTDPDDAAIAGAAIAMAHSLRLRVTAEGVETVEQLELLRSLNCDDIQGYFVSRPVPGEELTQILAGAQRDSLHTASRAA